MVNSIIWHCIHWYFHLLLYTSTWIQYLNLYSQIICFSKKWYVNNRIGKSPTCRNFLIYSHSMWRKCIVHFVSMALRHQIKSCCIDKFHCHIEKNNSSIFQFENRVIPLPKFCDKSKIHACHIIHQVLYNF